MNVLALGGFEVVLPLLHAETDLENLLSRTMQSLEALKAAGIKVTMVVVGDSSRREEVLNWIAKNAGDFAVRELSFNWSSSWSVLSVGNYMKAPLFSVLMPGEIFVCPQDIDLHEVTSGTLYFTAPSPDQNGRLAFWTAGSLAPLKLGSVLSTPVWNARLCERAHIMLERFRQARQDPQIEPWEAYLAVNEERLASVYRLIQL